MNDFLTYSKEFIQKPLFAVITAFALYFLIRMILFSLYERFIKNNNIIFSARRITNVVTTIILTTFTIYQWSRTSTSIIPYLSIFSAGLAIAMHDTISNITGWLFIIWKKPLAQGDRVQVEKNVGDVIDITPLYFTMLEVGGERIGAEQSTGRIIHIPNGKLLRNEIINYNEGFDYIWHEITVTITFESDWKLAKSILDSEINSIAGHYPEAAKKAMRRASRKLAIKQGKLTPIIYTRAVDYGVSLTVRFIVSPRQIRGIESKIWETVLMRFQGEKSISLAYPTTRFFQPEKPQC